MIYAVVLEAVAAHNLKSSTRGKVWREAKDFIATEVIAGGAPGGPPRPWFAEVTVNRSRECRVTSKELTRDPPDSETGLTASVSAEVIAVLLGPGALGLLFGAFAAFVARTAREIARIARKPFRLIAEAERLLELIGELEAVNETFTAITELLSAARATDADREQALADAMPNLVELLWRIGAYVVEGRDVVELLQNAYTEQAQRPTEPGTTQKSFTSLTGQKDWYPPHPPRDTRYEPLERLIVGHEYGLPAGRATDFVDRLLTKADEICEENDQPLIVIINLRFTRPTRATLGMQRHDLTGHVEVFTIRDLEGNREFHAFLHALAREFEAAPHWGQLHDPGMDFPVVFGRGLLSWQLAMTEIARSSGGDPNTFRHSFALERHLLEDL